MDPFTAFIINMIIGLTLRAIAWMLTDPPPSAEAGTMADLSFPKTREGTDAGIVFGFVWRDSSNIFHHWTGDFKTKPIKSTVGKKG